LLEQLLLYNLYLYNIANGSGGLIMKNTLVRTGLGVGMVTLLVFSVVTPMAIGYDEEMGIKEVKNRYDNFEIFNVYNLSELSHSGYASSDGVSEKIITSSPTKIEKNEPTKPIMTGVMDSPWPMYCHDTRHTGRSPYSTADTTSTEKWKFKTKGWAGSSPVIDKDGTIYIGSWDFYAVYPNGTLKWDYNTGGIIESCPAINEDGVIYVGTGYGDPNYLYAFYPNGTLKWKYETGGDDIWSSPVIGNDGTIYFGEEIGYPLGGYINALYPNGTLRWRYKTNHVIYSSPAIGDDGTIYCGSHDCNVYALYPNNGTLKWKFKTGSWVHGSPTIADDGTIYIGSDDGYLYALYPDNGTVKWKCNVGCIRASPALDEDETLYVGVWEKMFYAIYPNGTIKWSFDPGDRIWGSSAAISNEGIIYFGTCDLETQGGKDIIALNPDGTEKWRKRIGTLFSSPAIGEDGTVYIGASGSDDGYLVAFGIGELEADADGPYYGLVSEPVEFNGSATGGYHPYTWHWDFGDGDTSEEQNPTYTYTDAGNYTVILTVTDNSSNQSSDTSWAWIQTSNDPPNKPSITGETNGDVGTSYDYTVTASDPDESIIWYYIDWGDGSNTGWLGPYNNGQTITRSHTWGTKGTYNISCKAKDPYDAEGPWGYLEVEMPVNYQISQQQSNSLFFQILQRLMNIR